MTLNYKSRFNEILNSEIAPILVEIEAMRKGYLFSVWFLFGIWTLIIIASIGVVYCYFKLEFQIDTILVLVSSLFPLFSPLGFMFFYAFFDKKYTKKLKEKIVNKLAQAFGDVKKVEPKEDMLSIDFIKKSRLFPLVNYRDDDDCFIGKRAGVPFFILETKFYQSGGMAPTATFLGLLLCIKTKKPFGGVSVLKRRTNLLLNIALWVFIAGMLFWAFTSNDPEIIRKVGIPPVATMLAFAPLMIKDFKKKREMLNFKVNSLKNFEIETTDENEAKSLFTKELFNKLQVLKKIFGAQSVNVSFFEKNILVSIGTRNNVFEVGKLSKSVYDIESYKTFYNELLSLVSLVEYFKNSPRFQEFFEIEE